MTNSEGLPIRLERPPLIEAVFELRFSSEMGAVGDLLPGLFFSEFKNRFVRVEQLPLASVPSEIRLNDPKLKYLPHLRLSGPGEALLIGEHVLTISKAPPYQGWNYFKGLCLSLLGRLRATELIERLDRFSFKCVNLLSPVAEAPLEPLEVDVKLGRFQIAQRGFQLRSELDHARYRAIVEVRSDVSVSVAEEHRSGLLLSVDLLSTSASDFWDRAEDEMEEIHHSLKEVFFALLTPKTLESLGPRWE